MVTPFNEWKSNLLCDRGLSAPDGRPLYDYRLEDTEFASLESLLRSRLSQYQFLTSLGMISENISGFPALFVLYAAEWWRQRYDGSGWTWDPILRDLGANIDGWNPTQRSACVSRGLQDWCLLLRETGGLRYLGTIALQGGLPMRLLAEAKGGLGRLLRSVLKEAAKSVVTTSDIQGWVQSLDHYLPRTYRQTEIYVLLAEVVATVLRLKQEANLTQSAGAVAQLEKIIPSWRQRFPLPVGDADAQGLIEQLIRDAVDVKIERQTRVLLVERFLERDMDGLWHLRSSLTLPDIVATSKLSNFFARESVVLPRLLDLTLSVANRKQTTFVRRMPGHDSYRIEPRPMGVLDTDAVDEHVLRLSAADGQVWSITAPRGEFMDENLPWVFDVRDESPRLLRQGAGSVATNDALVAIPSDWVIALDDEGTASLEGQLYSPERKLFRIGGTVHFSSSLYGSCRIRTGRADAKEGSYEWIGQRLWLEFISPSMVFLGKPRLYQTDEDGRLQSEVRDMGFRFLGSKMMPGTAPVGPVEFWYPATGEVKFRSRMVILPVNANLRIESLDANSSRIHLEKWGAMSIHVLSSGVTANFTRTESDLTIVLKVSTKENLPEFVELDIHWSQSTKPVRLRLPYPARGARIYNVHDKELPPKTLLAANQLTGVRIHAVVGNLTDMPRMTLEFRLRGKSRQSIHTINPPKQSVQVEIRLQDYMAEIAHLLSNDDSPDASIDSVLRIGGEAHAKLRIARYACRMERGSSQVYLDAGGIQRMAPDALATLPVMALRLESSGEEAVRLVAHDSQGVATGTWEFAPETRDAGSWLIFPTPGSEFPFRPTLWTVSGDIVAAGNIAQAIGLTDPEDRKQALDAAIQAMASDFLEQGWADLERLNSQLGHLPLVTLDLWRRFARSATGMAAMAMRFGTLPAGFLERFSLELPFAWELVPFITWRNTIELLKNQCDMYGVAGATVFSSHLESRIAKLISIQPALNKLLNFARAAVVGEEIPEVQAFKHSSALTMLNGMLFSGEQSPLQRLLRNYAEVGSSPVQWPTFFNGCIAHARKHSLHVNLLCQQDFGFHDGLINLPILLAIQAATNASWEWFEKPDMFFDLREVIAFDPDWFTDAYDLTIARCLAAGLLNFEVA